MSLFQSFIPAFSRASAPTANGTDAGPTVRPLYEIKETDDAYDLTVYLPGVAKDGLDLTVEENEFRLTGRRGWKQPEGWAALHRESGSVPFELVLAHENAVDAEKVTAELRDGALRVSLAKHAALKPRKIAVG